MRTRTARVATGANVTRRAFSVIWLQSTVSCGSRIFRHSPLNPARGWTSLGPVKTSMSYFVAFECSQRFVSFFASGQVSMNHDGATSLTGGAATSPFCFLPTFTQNPRPAGITDAGFGTKSVFGGVNSRSAYASDHGVTFSKCCLKSRTVRNSAWPLSHESTNASAFVRRFLELGRD